MREQIFEKIRNGEMEAALEKLVSELESNGNDNDSKQSDNWLQDGSFLFQIAASSKLNDALTQGHPQQKAAQDLLTKIMTHSNLLAKDKSSGKTAFLHAIDKDKRNTAQAMLDVIIPPQKDPKEHKEIAGTDGIIPPTELIKHKDKGGQTALHYAVKHANHTLAASIYTRHKNLLWTTDKKNRSPLALAIECYHNYPTHLTFSLINQIYFALPDYKRGPQVQKKYSFSPSIIRWRSPLWKYALQYCVKTDEHNKPIGIDLNFLDLIMEVINKGLWVYGVKVTKKLMLAYVPDGTLHLFEEGLRTRKSTIRDRTLAQTCVNSTLLGNEEYMRRARFDVIKKYVLKKINFNPKETSGTITIPNAKTNAVLLYQDTSTGSKINRLFHVSSESGKTICDEIDPINFSARKKKIFAHVVEQCEEKQKPADPRTAKLVTAIVPQLLQRGGEMRTMRRPNAMSLFSTSSHSSSSNETHDASDEKNGKKTVVLGSGQ